MYSIQAFGGMSEKFLASRELKIVAKFALAEHDASIHLLPTDPYESARP